MPNIPSLASTELHCRNHIAQQAVPAVSEPDFSSLWLSSYFLPSDFRGPPRPDAEMELVHSCQGQMMGSMKICE